MLRVNRIKICEERNSKLTCNSKLTWKKLTEKDCREWKLTTKTLKKEAPGDQVRDLLCLQLASYLQGGPLMRMMPLHLHVNKKSEYDDDDAVHKIFSMTSVKKCKVLYLFLMVLFLMKLLLSLQAEINHNKLL